MNETHDRPARLSIQRARVAQSHPMERVNRDLRKNEYTSKDEWAASVREKMIFSAIHARFRVQFRTDLV